MTNETRNFGKLIKNELERMNIDAEKFAEIMKNEETLFSVLSCAIESACERFSEFAIRYKTAKYHNRQAYKDFNMLVIEHLIAEAK